MTSTNQKFQGLVPQIKHRLAGLLGMFALVAAGPLAANVLQEISYATASDGSVRVVLHLAEPATGAQAFTTEDPPRIAIDLPGTSNRVVDRRITVGSGATNAISAVEAGGRTRVVVDLFESAVYQAYADGSSYVIDITASARTTAAAATPGLAADPAKRIGGHNPAITNVDFRRTPDGAARVLLELGSENVIADLRSEGQAVVIDLQDVDVPERLRQKLDVTDFATPVRSIETAQRNNGARVTVSTAGEFETLAYQTGNQYVLEVLPQRAEASAATEMISGLGREEKKGYSGTPVTFNFQEIPVRTVLQLIAEESGLNVVAADSVSGNVTLRLINVPWDQALDIVLRAKSLDKRSDGGVVWVAPQSEIAAYEKAIADARKEMEERAVLVTEYIPINYGSASEIASLLTDSSKSGGGSGQGGDQARGFLSTRGSVSFDPRTNTLLLNDSAEKIAEIKELIALLDRPVDQVLIEARIVIASESFARELGARFGISSGRQEGDNTIITTSGSLNGSTQMARGALANRLDGRNALAGIGANLGGNDRLNVNLPVANPAGAIGFSILGADYLLDLELSALQSEGRGEVVSSPRVITSNQREATISQGREVGYVTTSGVGANATPTVNFKEALLELKVTPTITQDGRVFLSMGVKKDEIVGYVNLGELGSTPELAKREVTTAVLVDSGQTVVVGGVYEFTSQEDITKVPFLGDVPVLGNLFRNKRKDQTKAELLIFVTPKVLNVAGPRG
ncbi:type IV pilus secretin PilQ [Xanthomonadaceae bacterium JHOS43]|nr:type IV pilus secretin PilQ [Xanthomonadaceae bacterium JHOS43]